MKVEKQADGRRLAVAATEGKQAKRKTSKHTNFFSRSLIKDIKRVDIVVSHPWLKQKQTQIQLCGCFFFSPEVGQQH